MILSSVNFALTQGKGIETYNLILTFGRVYRLCFEDQAGGCHGFEESVGALWSFEDMTRLERHLLRYDLPLDCLSQSYRPSLARAMVFT